MKFITAMHILCNVMTSRVTFENGDSFLNLNYESRLFFVDYSL